jgi:exonuclease SbcC
MRWRGLKLHGIGPFADVAIDLEALPGPLVCVSGGNGEGKSVLLESLVAPLYRKTPTRGTLVSLATGRDSYAEVDVVNGAAYRIRQLVDAVSGHGESVVTDDAGASLIPDAKVSSFDAWAAKRFPPATVLYATAFASQTAKVPRGFLDLGESDRKGIILRALGIERLELMAEATRKRAAATKTAADTARARLADEQARGGSVEEAAIALDMAQEGAQAAERALAEAREALATAEAQAVAAREARRAAEALELCRSELRQRIEAAKTQHDQLQGRIENNRGLLGKATEIRHAAERIPQIDTEIATLEGERRSAEQMAASSSEMAKQQRLALDAASKRHLGARTRRANAGAAEALRAEVQAAKEALPAATQAEVTAVQALTAATDARETLQGQRAAGADQRILDLRTGHELVRDGCEDPPRIAANALDLDDQRVVLARELPGRLQAAASEVASAARALQAAQKHVRELEATAARRTEVDRLEADHVAALADMNEAEAAIGAAEQAVGVQQHQAEGERSKAATLVELVAKLRAERADLERSAKLAERLAQAEARIAELEPQAAAAKAEHEKLRAEQVGLPEATALPVVPDTVAPKRAADAAERAAREAAGALAVAVQRVEAAKEAAGRLEAMAAELGDAEASLADWTRLADDLGRDGLQAEEIGNAAPELNELTNDMIRRCISSRWTVVFETKRTTSDGKRDVEAFDVRVLDTHLGRDATDETLSGGQRTLVSEAIRLALSMLRCPRGGPDGGGIDLIRDETAAALDKEHGAAYVGMLRRAAEIIGAKHVYFVSHDSSMQDLADSRLVVSNGKVEVR